MPAEDFDHRERPDDPRQGFRVRFEQPFLHGPGRDEGVAFRKALLPFAPFPGLVVVFENDLLPRIEGAYWHMATKTFWCRLERDTAIFPTTEEALACYGEGWRLDEP